MQRDQLKRSNLRAPLKSEVLYEISGDVLSAKVLNISEGGILLKEMPLVPEVEIVPLMFCLSFFPDFGTNYKEKELLKEVVRIKARMVRKMEGMSVVDKIFITQIGLEFVDISSPLQKKIGQYVSGFSKNLVYFLSLFQNNADDKIIKKAAQALGYDKNLDSGNLRLMALHDYQSLESL